MRFHPAEAASPFRSTRNSASGTRNSAFPQFKQTESTGKAQTIGFSRPLSPAKWMATSAVNWLQSDPHPTHVIIPSFKDRIYNSTDCVVCEWFVANRLNRDHQENTEFPVSPSGATNTSLDRQGQPTGPTPASLPCFSVEANAVACKSCGSKNQEEVRTETAIHLPDLNKPLVFIFPTLLICLNCGKPEIAAEFTVPRDELLLLARRTFAKGGWS